VRFWDASAVICLCVEQSGAEALDALRASDPEVCVWWGTRTECLSGLCRLQREGILDAASQGGARQDLRRMAGAWSEVAPEEPVRLAAERMLERHALRTGDSFQLAAALQWCGNAPSGAGFVTLDRRLAEAARKEGFSVLP
jgi:predicted nucleic acid-binding protein